MKNLVHRMALMAGVLLATAAVSDACAQNRTRGIQGKAAPSWDVSTWFNLPGGATNLDIDDYQGKVLYLYCFQSWCPGCHSSGFPTLQKVIEQFDGDSKVAFVAVQTAFEGHSTNTAAAARKTGRRYSLDIPIGHSGESGSRPPIMGSYRTGGTPWTIIIGKDGTVQYNDFHIKPEAAKKLITRLKAEKYEPARKTVEIETLPGARGGQDVVGKKLPPLRFVRWINTPENKPAETKGKVTLYRWWTSECPYCRSSLPAIEKLRKKYEKQGLEVVCVYHPKPPRDAMEVDVADVKAIAELLGYGGAVTIDPDWSELRRAYLNSARRSATSVTFLVDGDGVTRFLHPGPEFFPSDDSGHARQNADYELLERAIAALLEEAAKRTENSSSAAGASGSSDSD